MNNLWCSIDVPSARPLEFSRVLMNPPNQTVDESTFLNQLQSLTAFYFLCFPTILFSISLSAFFSHSVLHVAYSPFLLTRPYNAGSKPDRFLCVCVCLTNLPTDFPFCPSVLPMCKWPNAGRPKLLSCELLKGFKSIPLRNASRRAAAGSGQKIAKPLPKLSSNLSSNLNFYLLSQVSFTPFTHVELEHFKSFS